MILYSISSVTKQNKKTTTLHYITWIFKTITEKRVSVNIFTKIQNKHLKKKCFLGSDSARMMAQVLKIWVDK